MKKAHVIATLMALVLGYGCGSKSGGSSAGNEATTQIQGQGNTASTSYYFNTKADLPECSGAMVNALAFVNSEKRFYNCSSNEWNVVEITGPNSLVSVEEIKAGSVCASGGKAINTGMDNNNNDVLDAEEIATTDNICNSSAVDGFKVISSYMAIGDYENLCDLFDAFETCYFEVGGVDVFANGNWQVKLIFHHSINYYNETTGDSDTDVNRLDATFILPNGETQGAIKRLDDFIVRVVGDGYDLWAVIAAKKDAIHIVHDTNGNGLLDATDLVIADYPLVKQ